ncbi:MAG: hypothetical protein HYR60_21750 [Acidobacteria bacterium]|nr:hypothetical protein [Acidobacteriota bacterium]
MKTIGRTSLLLALLAGVGLLAPHRGLAAVSGHNINAKGIGQDLGGGMTVADIIGGGLLQGTTAAAFAPTGFPLPFVTFAGTVTFTTHNGTLTVAITGALNVLTGDFSASGAVIGATGKLAGASGTLTFVGNENLLTGVFTEDIDGQILVDLAP